MHQRKAYQFSAHYESKKLPAALFSSYFVQVFDGHGGKDAASFTRENILKFITEDSHFPDGVKRALRNAFVRTDHALADHKNLDRSSGTTAITALILGR